MAALVCSLSPERTIGAFTFVRPSALLYDVVPMFRSYARFGVVVQLMAALLAGIGVDYLRRAGTRRAQIACLALVALAAGEYAVVAVGAVARRAADDGAPLGRRGRPSRVRVLDCTPLNQESASVQWLTGDRVTLLGGSIERLHRAEPCRRSSRRRLHASARAARHRRRTMVRRRTRRRTACVSPRSFDDGQVFAVTARTPAIYTATMTGFFPREHDAEWTWRWMGADAAWTIVNTSARPIVATLGLEMSAFHRARRMELRLDGRPVQTLVVEPSRRIYQIGPLTVIPGDHELVVSSGRSADVAGDVIDNGDRRAVVVCDRHLELERAG